MQTDTPSTRPTPLIKNFMIPAEAKETDSCRRGTWRVASFIPCPGDSLEAMAGRYVKSDSALEWSAYVFLATGCPLDAFIKAGSPYAQFFVKPRSL